MQRLGTAQPAARAIASPWTHRAIVNRLIYAAALTGLFVTLSFVGNAVASLLPPFDYAPLSLATQLLGPLAGILDTAMTMLDVAGALWPLFIPRDASPLIASTAPTTAFAVAIWALFVGPISNKRRVA